MDVKQPGKNGFEVVAAVQHRPAVIVTSMAAHDGAKAFEFQAIGYLLDVHPPTPPETVAPEPEKDEQSAMIG